MCGGDRQSPRSPMGWPEDQAPAWVSFLVRLVCLPVIVPPVQSTSFCFSGLLFFLDVVSALLCFSWTLPLYGIGLILQDFFEDLLCSSSSTPRNLADWIHSCVSPTPVAPRRG
uniref:Uncharacterized protein n=1 Tax=Sphaerodactylus townsendi TaxID=933632 RepID=A0ACB8ENH8_9SAUR